MIAFGTTMTTSAATTPAPPRSGASKLAIVAVLTVAIALFFYWDLGRFLSLDALKQNRDQLLAFTEGNYTVAVALFILSYIAVTGLSLPGAVILTLAGAGHLRGPSGQWCTVRPGDVVAWRPGTAQDYACDPATGTWELAWAHALGDDA